MNGPSNLHDVGSERPQRGDVEVLDAARRDADRVVLCRCGGFGRVHHEPLLRSGSAEGYVRIGFTCSWDRPGPHGPLLPPGGRRPGPAVHRVVHPAVPR